jgi:60Kd inner membrane protein
MPELTIASPARRAAAEVLDGLIYVAGFSLAALAVSDRGKRGLSPRLFRTIAAVGHAAAVPGRNWRGPGSRLLGTRMVDARTGGPVSVRSAFVLTAVSSIEREAARPLTRRAASRMTTRSAALKPRMDEIRRATGGDAQAQQRALMDLYKAEGVNPLAGCLSPLAAGFAFKLPVLWSPRHQTIGERLAGVVVVVDR